MAPKFVPGHDTRGQPKSSSPTTIYARDMPGRFLPRNYGQGSVLSELPASVRDLG